VRVLANGRDLTRLTARDVMTSNVVSCRDTDEAEHAAEIMESKQIRRLPVLDRNHKMVGMVSLGDISQLMPRTVAAEVLKSVSAHHV
jgi:CBS-domain-containing membrane protein